jgi:hypothetical protein
MKREITLGLDLSKQHFKREGERAREKGQQMPTHTHVKARDYGQEFKKPRYDQPNRLERRTTCLRHIMILYYVSYI